MRVVKNYHTLKLITHQGEEKNCFCYVHRVHHVFEKKIDVADAYHISN